MFKLAFFPSVSLASGNQRQRELVRLGAFQMSVALKTQGLKWELEGGVLPDLVIGELGC